jgi:hypothetical protein
LAVFAAVATEPDAQPAIAAEKELPFHLVRHGRSKDDELAHPATSILASLAKQPPLIPSLVRAGAAGPLLKGYATTIRTEGFATAERCAAADTYA